MDAKTELHRLLARARPEDDGDEIEAVVIFGNLPFNVATPILTNISMAVASTSSSRSSSGRDDMTRWSNLLQKSRSLSLVFMFQKEVARVCPMLHSN